MSGDELCFLLAVSLLFLNVVRFVNYLGWKRGFEDHKKITDDIYARLQRDNLRREAELFDLMREYGRYQ